MDVFLVFFHSVAPRKSSIFQVDPNLVWTYVFISRFRILIHHENISNSPEQDNQLSDSTYCVERQASDWKVEIKEQCKQTECLVWLQQLTAGPYWQDNYQDREVPCVLKQTGGKHIQGQVDEKRSVLDKASISDFLIVMVFPSVRLDSPNPVDQVVYEF